MKLKCKVKRNPNLMNSLKEETLKEERKKNLHNIFIFWKIIFWFKIKKIIMQLFVYFLAVCWLTILTLKLIVDFLNYRIAVIVNLKSSDDANAIDSHEMFSCVVLCRFHSLFCSQRKQCGPFFRIYQKYMRIFPWQI